MVDLIKDKGLDLPAATIPGINVIIEIGKWLRKELEAPPEAIKELCEKHKIDPQTISSLEELRNRLDHSGRDGKEVDLVLNRIKAEVDFPVLVRYLESFQEKISGRLAELLSEFQKFHLSIKGPYALLSPAEVVLQDPPTGTRYANPQFFRKTGPVAADIRGKKVHIRPEVKEVYEALKKYGAVLLHGVAASGKTVLVRLVAYRWFKTGKPVRFVQLKTESVDLFKLIDETVRFGKEHPNGLLVIEDVHLQAALINQFLSKKAQVWPKVLLTSRSENPELHSQSNNQFDQLRKIHLQPHNATKDIVTVFFQEKGWQLSHKLSNDITLVSNKNLWVLSYVLNSLERTNGTAIDESSVREAVRRDLEDLGRQDPLFPVLLIMLSVLYRHEIPTDQRFIFERFPKSSYRNEELRHKLRKLVEIGEVTLVCQGDHRLYGLPHSALAHLYSHFRKGPDWEEEAIYGDENLFISDYISSPKAVNGLEFFRFARVS